MTHYCGTVNPPMHIQEKVFKELQNAPRNKSTGTIEINVVYHICTTLGYPGGQTDPQIELDCIEGINELNRTFQKDSTFFNSKVEYGQNIYSTYNVPNITFLPLLRRLRLIRITRRIRANRRRFIRTLRINQRRRRINRRRNRINRRRRRINRNRRRILNNHITNANLVQANLETFNNYVARAKEMDINFVLDDIIYSPLGDINSYDINIIDNLVKLESRRKNLALDNSNKNDLKRQLDVWIVNFTNVLLGYAHFPTDYDTIPQFDGVVLSRRAFGVPKVGITYSAFNSNKTLVHEVGHWLNLYHVFEIINNTPNDLVGDTPPQVYPNYGNPFNRFNWPRYQNIRNMFFNYMDYCNDFVVFEFTEGQVQRMCDSTVVYR